MAMPKEPRQMMINMMYLVLTAMLAMNVSAEILNAFNIVNNGIVTGQTALKTKNQLTYKIIDDQYELNKGKAQLAYDRSKQAKKIADALFDEIEKYKQQIITKAEGYEPETHRLKNEKDLDAAGDIFIGPDEKGTIGSQVQKNINDTRHNLVNLLKGIPGVSGAYLISLDKQIALRADDYPDGEGDIEKKWWFHNFHSVPAVAGVTILNGIEQNIRTAESDVIDELLKTIGKTDFKFDTLTAEVVPDGPTIIAEGQQFKANAFLSAFDTKQSPTVLVNGSPVKVESGKGMISLGGGEGEHEYKVTIKITGPDGKEKVYNSKPQKYQVIKPFGSVSAEKMNAIYIGVDNPITVSAAGYTPDKVDASTSFGALTKVSAGHYTIKVDNLGSGTTSISLNGKSADGKVNSVGAFPFRIKRIPDPIAEIGGFSGGKMPATNFKAQAGISAVLKDFLFDCTFKVTKYDCYYTAKRQDTKIATGISSNMFNDQIKGWVGSAKPGDQFIFDNIYARGCDGTPRKLPPLTVIIQ